MEHLQRLPKVGEQIRIDGCLFEPLEIQNHRINRVKITLPENPEDSDD